MKILWAALLISTLIPTSLSFAQSRAKPVSKNFAYWQSGSWAEVKSPWGPLRTLIVQKKLSVKEAKITELTLSFNEIPAKTVSHLSEKQMAEQIRQALNLPGWQSNVQDGISVFEAPLKSANRYIRLFIKKDKNRVLISLANARSLFAYPVLLEAEYLQRLWFKNESLKHVSRFEMFAKDILPEAQARMSGAEIEATLKSLLSSIGSDAGNQIAGVISQATGQVTAATNTIAGTISDSTDKITSMVTRVTSFKSMFTVGLGLSLGSVVGTAVGNFIVDGAVGSVKSLYYAIFNKLDPETKQLMMDRTMSSLDQLDAESRQLQAIESQINAQMAALAFAANNTGENLALSVDARMTLAEVEIKKIEKIMMETSDENMKATCAVQAASLKQNAMRVLETIRPLVDNKNYDDICRGLRQNLDEWIRAEHSLDLAKNIVVQDMSMIASQAIQSTNASLRSMASDKKVLNACENEVDGLRGQGGEAQQMAQLDQLCQDMSDTRSSLDPKAARAKSTGVLVEHLKALKDKQIALIQSDCRIGESSKNCDGAKQGSFQQLHERYNKLVSAHNAICKDSPALPAAMQELKNGGTPATISQVSDTKAGLGSVTQSPSTTKKNIFARSWSWMKGLFSWIF